MQVTRGGQMLTSAMFGELGRIRAEALREEARRGSVRGRRSYRSKRGAVRVARGTGLVSAGLWVMRREVA
jgi:hypothetical protein